MNQDHDPSNQRREAAEATFHDTPSSRRKNMTTLFILFYRRIMRLDHVDS